MAGKMVMVFLDDGESGWAELLEPGSGTVRIANIPMSGEYNLDDVVKVDTEALKKHPYNALPGVVIERPFPVRTILRYELESDYPKIYDMATKKGAKIEGLLGPSKGHKGVLSIAAKSEKDVQDIINLLELIQPDDFEINTL